MILITGSSSFLGEKIALRLAEEGGKLRCLDDARPGKTPPGAEFLTGTCLDEGVLKKACAGADTVIHLMDVHRPGLKGRSYMRKNNVRGTKKLLDAAKTAGVKRFFFISSYEVYGKTRKDLSRPGDKLRPVTGYGRDKKKIEKYLEKFKKTADMEITVFRPALVVGPGTDNPIILITLLMAMGMEEANRMYIAGSGENRFQMIHPDDAADAIARALKSGASKDKIYNLGSDNVPTHEEVVNAIQERAELSFTIKRLTPGYTRFLSILLKPFKINYLNREHLTLLLNNLIMDCGAAKSDLGWQPTRGNIEIMLETINWYEKEKL